MNASLSLNGLKTVLDISYSQKLLSYLISASNSDGTYVVYPHMRDKFSIFLDEKQVGVLVRTGEYGVGTSKFNWTLKTDTNANFLAILLLSYASFILGDKAFNIQSDYALGNNYWLKEAKSFDSNWKPLN